MVAAAAHDSGDEWRPDLRTLRWAAELIDAERLGGAIAHDVQVRTTLPEGVTAEVWQAAGDAAYEATWWPIMREARRLNGDEDELG